MASRVQYKFKSATTSETVVFEGMYLSVGDLKREIVEKKGLSRDHAAELLLSEAQTGREWTDDAELIQKNTSVIVRRVPGQKAQPLSAPADKAPGAAPEKRERVIAVRATHQPGFRQHRSFPSQQVAPAAPSSALLRQEGDAAAEAGQEGQEGAGGDNPEDAAITAMVTSTAEDWQRQQMEARMSGRGRGRGDGRGGGRGRGRSDGPPPVGYTCNRCCQGGHWIQACPTNNDPDFERRKVRQPLGIPLARLQANEDGTLLLPDGQSATLTAAEDILERELGFLRSRDSAQQLGGAGAAGGGAEGASAEAMQLAIVTQGPPAAPPPASAFTATQPAAFSPPAAAAFGATVPHAAAFAQAPKPQWQPPAQAQPGVRGGAGAAGRARAAERAGAERDDAARGGGEDHTLAAVLAASDDEGGSLLSGDREHEQHAPVDGADAETRAAAEPAAEAVAAEPRPARAQPRSGDRDRPRERSRERAPQGGQGREARGRPPSGWGQFPPWGVPAGAPPAPEGAFYAMPPPHLRGPPHPAMAPYPGYGGPGYGGGPPPGLAFRGGMPPMAWGHPPGPGRGAARGGPPYPPPGFGGGPPGFGGGRGAPMSRAEFEAASAARGGAARREDTRPRRRSRSRSRVQSPARRRARSRSGEKGGGKEEARRGGCSRSRSGERRGGAAPDKEPHAPIHREREREREQPRDAAGRPRARGGDEGGGRKAAPEPVPERERERERVRSDVNGGSRAPAHSARDGKAKAEARERRSRSPPRHSDRRRSRSRESPKRARASGFHGPPEPQRDDAPAPQPSGQERKEKEEPPPKGKSARRRGSRKRGADEAPAGDAVASGGRDILSRLQPAPGRVVTFSPPPPAKRGSAEQLVRRALPDKPGRGGAQEAARSLKSVVSGVTAETRKEQPPSSKQEPPSGKALANRISWP